MPCAWLDGALQLRACTPRVHIEIGIQQFCLVLGPRCHLALALILLGGLANFQATRPAVREMVEP